MLTTVQHGEITLPISHRLQFIVPGMPVAWDRARRHGDRYFNADEQIFAREDVAQAYRLAAGNQQPWPNPHPVVIVIDAYIPPLACWRPVPSTKPPDYDNYAKLVGDALSGLAYRDDRQIIDGRCRKHFGTPRFVIELTFCLEPPKPRKGTRP